MEHIELFTAVRAVAAAVHASRLAGGMRGSALLVTPLFFALGPVPLDRAAVRPGSRRAAGARLASILEGLEVCR